MVNDLPFNDSWLHSLELTEISISTYLFTERSHVVFSQLDPKYQVSQVPTIRKLHHNPSFILTNLPDSLMETDAILMIQGLQDFDLLNKCLLVIIRCGGRKHLFQRNDFQVCLVDAGYSFHRMIYLRTRPFPDHFTLLIGVRFWLRLKYFGHLDVYFGGHLRIGGNTWLFRLGSRFEESSLPSQQEVSYGSNLP